MPSDAAQLDQYYTHPDVARVCVGDLLAHLDRWQVDPTSLVWLEPSAGGGAFLDALTGATPTVPQVAVDLDPAPHRPEVVSRDFLAEGIADLLPPDRTVVTVGNPPFGRKAALAAAFLNAGLGLGPIVAFIVPIQFHKWSAQRLIQAGARLIEDKVLPAESFVFQGKPYAVRCTFQVWARDDFGPAQADPDLRLANRPRTDHPDFSAWQYNRTDIALKYFDYDWDFAVPRQGYQDYTFKATAPEQCDRKQQWIFFKAHSVEALTRLKALDFVALSKKNTGLPGFGKADVVAAYEALLAADSV